MTISGPQLLKQLTQKGLGRNGLFAVIQSLISIFAVFFSFRILIDNHGIEALGLWSVSVGLVSFVRLADVSGGAALARFVAIAAPEMQKIYIDTVLIFNLIFYAILCALIWVPFTYLISLVVDPEYLELSKKLIPYVVGSLFLIVISNSQLNALDGLHRADLRAIVASIGFLVFLVLAFIWVPEQGVIGLAKAQITQSIFLFFTARLVCIQKISGLILIPIYWNMIIFKEMLAYGLKLQLNSVATLIFDPLTKLVITHYSGLETLGIYELAYKTITYIRSFIMAALTPAIPEFAKIHKDDPEQSFQMLQKIQGYLNQLNLGFVFISLIAGPIISFLILSKISALFLIFTYALTFAFYINIFGIPIYLYAQAVGVLRWNIIGQFSIAILSVVMCVIFSYILPTENSPLGVFVGMSIGSIIMTFNTIKMFGLSFTKLTPKRILLLFTTAILFAQIVVYFLLINYKGVGA